MKAIVDIQTFKEHTALASRARRPKAVNPILNHLKLVADRASFLSGLARVSLFHEQDRLVNIELIPESKQLVLSASSSNSGRGTTTIAADIEGNAFSIYFNCKYLTDILRHMQASKILIQFNEANQPVSIIIRRSQRN